MKLEHWSSPLSKVIFQASLIYFQNSLLIPLRTKLMLSVGQTCTNHRELETMER